MIADQAVLQTNYKKVMDHVYQVATDCGRNPTEIKTVAVSKFHELEKIMDLHQLGQSKFGESQIQEAERKIKACAVDLEWHLIGHLQKNKTKVAVKLFQWLHSVDSLELIHLLKRQTSEQERTLNVLLQMNLTGELTKHGFATLAQVRPCLEVLLKECPTLIVRGLMTMGDPNADEFATQKCFATLRNHRDQLALEFGIQGSFTELSMGMTDDYPLAIREGATLLRIGSAIFGDRPFKQ